MKGRVPHNTVQRMCKPPVRCIDVSVKVINVDGEEQSTEDESWKVR